MGQLLQLGIDHLLGLCQDFNEITSLGTVGRCEEGVCCASSVFAASSADAMNVVLRVVGVVVVDDKLDIVHVQASGSDVRGHQNGGGSVLELSQHPISLFLLLVSVNAHGRVTVSAHESGQFVSLLFRLHKDL